MAVSTASQTYSNELEVFVNQQRAAVDLQHCIGKLLLEKSIELVLFRNHLVDVNTSDILRLHSYAAEVVGKPISVFDSAELADHIYQMDLAPAKIDIGKLSAEWLAERDRFNNKTDFLEDKLGNFLNDGGDSLEPRDVVLYGFGRIGRLCARELIKQAGKGQQLRLKAIVTRKVDETILEKRAGLLANDSVHGEFAGSIQVDYDQQCLLINGQRVQMIAANDPSEIDYTQYGINDALIIDSSGVWRDEAGLSKHLESKGASKVLLTTSGKGDMKNIVSGVNSDLVEPSDSIIAAASCTTNAIVPVLKCINDRFGIVHGHMETVHAYTDDQNLHDNIHSKTRRGRSAPLNMVLTESNATSSVGKLLPELKGKLSGNSIRVPVANVSMAILNLTLEAETTTEEVNEHLRDISLNSAMQRQIGYTVSNEVVSSDFIGDRHAGIVDSEATIVEGKQVVLYVWYDNEFGYTCQVIRVGQKMAGIKYPVIPAQPASGTDSSEPEVSAKTAQSA